MGKYYKIATLYPSVLVLIGVLIFSIIENYDYKSEWLTADAVIFMSFVTAFIFCFFICLLSLTILLNKSEKIRSNKYLSFLSWFLLPGSVLIAILILEVSKWISATEGTKNETKYTFMLCIPFLISLIVSYLKYKKRNG